MPTYDYVCQACGHEFELVQKMSDPPKKRCPECRGKIERKIGGGAGLLFKGSGFYITDYRSKDYHAKAKSEMDGAKPASSEAGGKPAPSEKSAGSGEGSKKATKPTPTD